MFDNKIEVINVTVNRKIKMERFIETYAGETFDVIVIGGGITGAAVAYDAASRGLSVALLEKQDFGSATSAATSKLIHGGFRYLANLEFGIVRESLRERRTLENIAPNLVYPIPVLIPCYNRGMTKHTWLMKSAMLLYDFLSYDKGWTWDKSKKIGLHQAISPREATELEPVIPKEGLKGVYAYCDCASIFPERLTLAFIKSAVKHGALVSNYSKVEGFIFSDSNKKKITGASVKVLINDRDVELSGKLIINCGGPWADLILGMAKRDSLDKRIRRSEGIHIIIRKIVNNNMVVFITPSGKGFFIIPWRGRALIGTTDKEYVGSPDEFKVTKPAILELLEIVNGALGDNVRIEYKDIIHTYGGLRPLVEDQTKEVRESSRKYEIYDNAKDGIEGLITVEGGKYTTSRNLAENVMKIVSGKLKRNPGKCITNKQYLNGCEIKDIEKFIDESKRENRDFDEKTIECLCKYYGIEFSKVLELAREDKSLSEPLNDDGEIIAQAVYAIRNEMALTLKDILIRRTGVGTLGNPGDEKIVKLADLAAKELNWDIARREREIREAKELFKLPE